MDKIKLAIVDDSLQMKQEVSKYFENNEKYELVFQSGDGLNAVEEIVKAQADIVLLDLVLPNKDGFTVLEELHSAYPKCKVIVTTALSGDNFVHKAMQLGASDYLVKPFDVRMLEKRLTNINIERQSETQKNVDSLVSGYRNRSSFNRNLDEKISNIFITVGIPAHIKGYQFLREAIKMAVDSPEIVNSITKKLYPSIAERFSTSVSKVERAIRHAIEVAWNRGKIENINSVFGLQVYGTNEKPTNGEFIALVADKMIIDGC